MWTSLAAAAAAFIATNLDDLLVLMLLFARAESRRGQLRVAFGQYLGLAILTVGAMLCARGLASLPEQYLRLLGLVPILLAFRIWRNREEEETEPAAAGVLATAALTLANGGDNLGVYIPLFAGFSSRELAAAGLVFAVLCGLWCLMACGLAARPGVQHAIDRHKGWLVPVVFLLLGLSILPLNE